MNNTKPRHVSIALKGTPQVRVYDTFEDWQAEQKADLRTPEQRGIHVGSAVMWRYRANQVITTERAIVMAIDDLTLTLQVKGVETRTCSAHVSEIVDSPFGHRPLTQTGWRPFIANQMEPSDQKNTGYTNEDTPSVSSWQ